MGLLLRKVDQPTCEFLIKKRGVLIVENLINLKEFLTTLSHYLFHIDIFYNIINN